MSPLNHVFNLNGDCCGPKDILTSIVIVFLAFSIIEVISHSPAEAPPPMREVEVSKYGENIHHGIFGIPPPEDAKKWCYLLVENDKNEFDLACIKLGPTDTHKIEVHLLSAKSKWTKYIGHFITDIDEFDGPFDFSLVDWNLDGQIDLVAIKKANCASGSIELHVYSGKSGKRMEPVIEKPPPVEPWPEFPK